MKFRRFFLFILIIFSLIILTGCKSTNETEELKSKADEEINYLDEKFISIANQLNNISFQNYKVETQDVSSDDSTSEQTSQSGSSSGSEQSKSSSQSSGENNENSKKISITEMKITDIATSVNQPLDWNAINGDIELLYGVWNTIILDLHKLNVPSDRISAFSTTLNELTINAEKQDKNMTALSVASLYSYLPVFLEYYSSDKENINIKNTKKFIINAYALVGIDNWDKTNTEIENAVQAYTPVLNNAEYTKYREHAVNSCYVMLNELKLSTKQKSKNIFYINYKNLINELNLL